MKAVQIKMARAALGWGVRDLAEKAGVTANTVTRIENGADMRQSTLNALQQALEAGGVQFIPENGGGAGVRLAKRQAEGPTEPTGKAGADVARALAEKRIEEHLADADLHPAEKAARKARLMIPVPKRKGDL